MSIDARLNSIKGFARRWGVDRAIFLVIIGRGWGVLAGPLTLLLIANFLSKDEQGYYYTFTNVLALTMVFELGITNVFIHFASHEKAQLEWTSRGTLEGDPLAKARLASLLRVAVLWYAALGLLVLAFILPYGLWFFSNPSTPTVNLAGGSVDWRMPWISVVSVTAFSCIASPMWAILEGCGMVVQIQSIRFVQQVGGNVLFWAALVGHAALFATPIVTAFGFLWGVQWLLRRRRHFVFDLLTFRHADSKFNWWRDFWPMQWRIGLSYLSYYFSFQTPNQILFKIEGATSAGQWGMSNALTRVGAPLGTAWISTKIPLFGNLIAQRRWAELDAIFFRALRQSVLIMVVIGAGVFMGCLVLHWIHHPLTDRLMPLWSVLLLVLVAPMTHVNFALAAYLRSHKREPLLWVSLAGGILMPVAGLVLTPFLGGLGMAIAFFLGIFMTMLFTIWMFVRKRREWHAEVEA